MGGPFESDSGDETEGPTADARPRWSDRDAAPTRATGAARRFTGEQGRQGERLAEVVRPEDSPRPDDLESPDALALTPFEAMNLAELARTRKFVPLVLLLGTVGLGALAIMPGGSVIRIVAVAGTLLAMGALGRLYVLASDPPRFTELQVTVCWMLIATGAFSHIYYWGVFSAASTLLPFGIFFVAMSNSERVSLFVFVFCCAFQMLLATLIITGVVEDRGVLRPRDLKLLQMVLIQCLILLVYSISYLSARASKRQSELWVTQLDREVRRSAQREALLLEVRQALDGALAEGRTGRFSEQTLGSYRLGTVIGRGGMGEIYEAVHVRSGERAAVKLLNLDALANADLLRRFLREAQIATAIDSPHVVKVFEVADPVAATVPYIAMERLEGIDLAGLLREQRVLSLAECDELMQQAAHGVGAAHTAGVIHRDLKPQNIFRQTRNGDVVCWKILDFGVSKLGQRHSTLTVGHVVGTPAYMPPEQACGESVDHRADIYGLTAVAYRALTGRPPAAGRRPEIILHNVLLSAPMKPSKLANVPADIERVLAIGLAKQRGNRFQSVTELAAAFSAAVTDSLPDSLRRRADELIAQFPWR